MVSIHPIQIGYKDINTTNNPVTNRAHEIMINAYKFILQISYIDMNKCEFYHKAKLI